MSAKLLLTFLALLLLIGGWVAVQAAARRVAARHPESGPFRIAGGGCGAGKGCGSCDDASCASESEEQSSNRQGH